MMSSSNLSMSPEQQVVHPLLASAYKGDETGDFHLPPDVFEEHKPYLHPTESFHSAERIRLLTLQDPLPAEKALMLLTHAETREDIGFEIPMAAAPLPENSGVKEAGLFTDAVFGRDALLTALYLQEQYPQLMQTTILELARRQCLSNENTEKNDGKIGKISHEDRLPGDPVRIDLERKNKWKFPYFGSVDATPLYVKAIASHVRFLGEKHGQEFLDTTYEGQDGNEHTIRESLSLAINFLKEEMDSNAEGLLEFKRVNPAGLENQGWQDSWDAYHHADGTIANHNDGIASVEVQGYVYDALLKAAALLPDASEDLQNRAKRLRKQVMDTFWVEDERGGYFALGTDRDESGNLRVMKIRKSNMGHLLNSYMLDGDDEETVYKRNEAVRTLFSDEMMSFNGIRTLSNREDRFKPTAYHNGTVWAHDNYFIAQGLDRHGYYGLARDIYEKVVRIHDITGKYPEHVQGNGNLEPKLNEHIVILFSGRDDRHNCVEQVAQEVQAWVVAAVIASEARMDTAPFHAADFDKRKMEDEILFKKREPFTRAA